MPVTPSPTDVAQLMAALLDESPAAAAPAQTAPAPTAQPMSPVAAARAQSAPARHPETAAQVPVPVPAAPRSAEPARGSEADGAEMDLAAATKTLEKLMLYAKQHNASDIFIAPDFPPSVKINGLLTPLSDKPLSPAQTQAIVFSTMNAKQRQEFAQNLELNYAVRPWDDLRFRVNAYHEQGRIGMVMRKINMKIDTVDELGLPQVLKKLALTPRGLIIVVGATGSGKSTSLAAMVDHRNKNTSGHIVTIEDPIEYVHRHHKSIVTQREIGIDTESWHEALKSAMRQAPDVVIVGEVRDEDSMSHAMQLSQTGHLCMCTLHATNANQAIERVINFYHEDRHPQVYMDLAINLCAIISQRLVRKADGSGRTVAMDIMLNSPAVQDLIFKGEIAGIKEIMERSEDEGMQTFDGHLLALYKQNVITFEEALRNADSVNNLRLAIKLYDEGNEKQSIFDRVSNLSVI